MKKIKGLLLFGILTLLGSNISFGLYYYNGFIVDTVQSSVLGDSFYNTINFFSHSVANSLPGFLGYEYYNNGNLSLGNSSGSYNKIYTGFDSTKLNSFFYGNGSSPGYSSWVSRIGNNGNFILNYSNRYFQFGTSYSSSSSSFNTYGGIRLISDGYGKYTSSRLNLLNFNNLDDSFNINFYGYEVYSPGIVLTNYGYINDYGSEGIKGKHFGLDSWGYSYGVNFSSDSSLINWSSFSFSSIGSNCLETSLKLGLNSTSDLIKNSCMSLGILVLKNNGYDFSEGGQGKYLLLSKNPDVLSGLLYEVFECNTYDNVDWLPNIMFDSKCTSLQHGTIDGVLPFLDSGSSFPVSSLSGFLGYIFNNSNNLFGFSSFSSSGFCLKNYSVSDINWVGGGYRLNSSFNGDCFSFNKSTQFPSIKELYVQNGGQIGPGGNGNQSTGSIAINTGLLNLCLNDLQFGELNSYLCNQLLSNLGNPVQIPGTSGQYISVSIDENGNLRYWITTQEDLAEQMSGFIWVENEDGSWSTVCPSGDCLGTVLAQPINHGNTGFVFSTGDVLDMMSNLTGWVGRCPFPYTDFRLGKNLKLLQLLQDYGFNYDPFIIINCSVAGFQYGRHTIDNTLFGDTFEHPLLYGDTPKHRNLFVFLDFVVILGLFGLFTFLKKIF